MSEIDKKIALLENLKGDDFTSWLQKALKGDARPLVLGHEEEPQSWLITPLVRESRNIKENVLRSVPALLVKYSLQNDGPDYLCDLLFLAGSYRIDSARENILGLLLSDSFKGVMPQRMQYACHGDAHVYLASALLSLAQANDPRLIEKCEQEIEREHPQMSVFYAILLRQSGDPTRYIGKYFPQLVACAERDGSLGLTDFIFAHYFSEKEQSVYFLDNMDNMLRKLTPGQLGFLKKEVAEHLSRIQERKERPMDEANREDRPLILMYALDGRIKSMTQPPWDRRGDKPFRKKPAPGNHASASPR